MNDKDQIQYPDRLEDTAEIRDYLTSVSRKFRSSSKRQEVKDEILSHIDAAISRHKAQGLSFSEAVKLVLEDMGDAYEVGNDLFDANLPIFLRRRIYLPVAAVLAIVGLFVGSLNQYSRRARTLLAERIEKTERFQEMLKKDSEVSMTLFSTPRDVIGQDFGQVINTRIVWNNLPGHAAEIVGSREISDLLSYYHDEWILKGKELDLSAVDTAWMKDLSRYAFWDLYGSGPGADFMILAEKNPFSVPQIDYVTLSGFSKIAILKGIQSGNLIEAVLQVEHLARLIYSHETLIGGLVSLSMLKENIAAVTFGKEQGLISHSFNLSYNFEQVSAAKRALTIRTDIFDFTNSVETLEKAFPTTNEGQLFGYCNALDEGTRTMLIYYQYFGGKNPLKKKYQASIDYVGEVLTASRNTCRARLAHYFWNIRNELPEFAPALFMRGDAWREGIVTVGSKLPIFREWVATMLVAMAKPQLTP